MSNLTSRLYAPADYPFLALWWHGHGLPEVPEAILPKCGVIVEKDGERVGFGCIYMDNSVGVAFMAYLTVCPDQVAKMCGAPISLFLIGALEELLKGFNYSVVVITTAVKPLEKILKRSGYSTCHNSTWEGMKVLK